MKHFRFCGLMTLSFFVAPLMSFANPGNVGASPSEAPTMQTMTQLNDEAVVLTKKLAIAKIEQQIKAAGSTSDPDSDAGAPTGVAQRSQDTIPGPSPRPVAAPTAMPQVVSITGQGSHLDATLALSNGSQVVVHPGFGLPGGLTVHDISAAGVTVMSGGQLQTLSYADGSVTQAGNTQQQPIGIPVAPPPFQRLLMPTSLPSTPQ